MTDDAIKTHIAKMEATHGDEPIRMKTALALARAARDARQALEDLIAELDTHWSFDNGQQHTHSWHDKQDFLEAWRAKIESLKNSRK